MKGENRRKRNSVELGGRCGGTEIIGRRSASQGSADFLLRFRPAEKNLSLTTVEVLPHPPSAVAPSPIETRPHRPGLEGGAFLGIPSRTD